jgi:hypothetical protein
MSEFILACFWFDPSLCSPRDVETNIVMVNVGRVAERQGSGTTPSPRTAS